MRLRGHVHRHSGPEAFQGRASRTYDFVARRLLRRAYRRLADDLVGAVPDGGAVLDVGTGPGVLLAEIAQRRPDVRLTGVDPSPDMVTAAQRNLGRFGDRATVRVGSAAGLPLPDGSFDLIVSSFSLHHWEDPAAAVPELARVLRPGGRLYIYDFRSAPFEALTAAAGARSLFTGEPPSRTLVRTGIPLFPRCVRYVLSAGG